MVPEPVKSWGSWKDPFVFLPSATRRFLKLKLRSLDVSELKSACPNKGGPVPSTE